MPRVLRWFLKTLLVLAVILFAAAIAFYFRPGKFFAGLHWLGYKLAGVHSKYAIFDSYRIHYLETGVGAPLVLVHGLGGSADDWATYLPALAKSGYHVYAPDLLGFGDSQKPDVDYSIALQTKVFSDFLDVQKLDRPDMGGWSMGGWIVLEFARLNPQRVRRLMVFDSAGLKYGQAPPESVLSPTTPEDLSKMEALLTPHPKPLPNFIARDVLRTIAANDWVVRQAMRSMRQGKEILDGKLQSLPMPVLIVWGKEDALTPVSFGREIHREIPESILWVVDGCGHLAPIECRSRVWPEVSRFLDAKTPLPSGEREVSATN